MNTLIKLLRKNLVLIASIALVCLVTFCSVQYGSKGLDMLSGEQKLNGKEEEMLRRSTIHILLLLSLSLAQQSLNVNPKSFNLSSRRLTNNVS